MQFSFVKMHGLGNDFVLLDRRQRPAPLAAEQLRLLADRRYGVGCDLVLLLDPPRDRRALARCSFVNADGSAAEHCGNGVRCVARYLARRGEANGTEVLLEIGDTLAALTLGTDDAVRVDMGAPRFAPAAIPLAVPTEAPRYPLTLDGASYEFGAVSMGNPHAVFAVADVTQAPVATVGAALQASALFPARVNAGFMQILDRGHVRLRVYERGVGETRACGTGACAAVAVGRRWGLLDRAVIVSLPGGELDIEWDASVDAPLYMTGPATHVFEGSIDL